MDKVFIAIGVVLILGVILFLIWDKTKSRLTATSATPADPADVDEFKVKGKYFHILSEGKRFGVLDTETYTLKKVVEEESGEVHYDIVTEFETPNFTYFIEGGKLKRTKKAQSLTFTPSDWK